MNVNKIEILHFVPIVSALTCLESNIRYINKVINPDINKDRLIIGDYKHHAFNRILSDVNFLRGLATELWKDIYGWIPGVEFLIAISKDQEVQEDNIFEYPFKWHLIKGNYEDYDTISKCTDAKTAIDMIGKPVINICERLNNMYNEAAAALLNITDGKQRTTILGMTLRFCNGVRALKGAIFAGSDDYELADSLIEGVKAAYKSSSVGEKAAIRLVFENIIKAVHDKDSSTIEPARGSYADNKANTVQFAHYDPNKDTITMHMKDTQSFEISAKELSKARSKQILKENDVKTDENGCAYYITDEGDEIKFVMYDPETHIVTLSINGEKVDVHIKSILTNENGENDEQN